jgi:hypothetical protein
MSHTRAGAVLILLLIAGLAGCAKNPGGPDSFGQTSLTGSVSDTLGQRLAGARVEIVDGRQAGHSATTDTAGSFSLKGTFDDATQVRASLDGYPATTASVAGWWPPHFGGAERSIRFTLAPPVVLSAGDEFTLTLAADDACTAIPPEFRTRTYDVTLVAHQGSGTGFSVVATGKEFLAGHNGISVGVTQQLGVTGQTLYFLLNEDGFPYLSEQVGPDAYLSFNGDASGSGASRGSVIVAAARGVVNYCEVSPPAVDYWDAVNRECPGTAVVHQQCRFSQLTLAPR